MYNAAFCGRAEVVKIMLAAGVDVNIQSKGETPLEVATKEGHWNVVEVIKAHLDPKDRIERVEKTGNGVCVFAIETEGVRVAAED